MLTHSTIFCQVWAWIMEDSQAGCRREIQSQRTVYRASMIFRSNWISAGRWSQEVFYIASSLRPWGRFWQTRLFLCLMVALPVKCRPGMYDTAQISLGLFHWILPFLSQWQRCQQETAAVRKRFHVRRNAGCVRRRHITSHEQAWCNMKNARPSPAKTCRTKSSKNMLAKGLLREVWGGDETAACVARICQVQLSFVLK